MDSSTLLWSFSGALIGSILTAIILPVTINATADRVFNVLNNGSMSKDPIPSYLYYHRFIPWQIQTEIGRRATTGRPLLQAFGANHGYRSLDKLFFNPVQFADAYRADWADVDLTVTLAPLSPHPLHLPSPLIISPPDLGMPLSKQIQQSYLQAVAGGGRAFLTGEQDFDRGQLEELPLYIISFPTTMLESDPGFLSRASMVELRMGQGPIPTWSYDREFEQKGKKGGLPGFAPHLLKIKPVELKRLIGEIKKLAGGIPVAIRLAAGNRLEFDLDICLQAGAEVVILESRETESMLAPAALAGQFGLSLLAAIHRSVSFLEKAGVKDGVSLVASGAMFSAADYCKVLALGCTAVQVDGAALVALLQAQMYKVLPWTPVNDLLIEGGKKARKLNVQKAAQGLGNYLQATETEMALVTVAAGRERIADLTRDNLCTNDTTIHLETGIALSF
jgi:hypothetical protein